MTADTESLPDSTLIGLTCSARSMCSLLKLYGICVRNVAVLIQFNINSPHVKQVKGYQVKYHLETWTNFPILSDLIVHLYVKLPP